MAKIFENKVFQDPEAARQWLEARLWPDGPVCGHCGVIGEARALSSRPGTYQCNACRKQFTVTVGTVFERSHIPLNKWLLATFLFTSSKKGISAHQIHRLLGITYKSAWFMMHRLREAVMPGPGAEPLGGPGAIVEADESELGRSNKTRPRPRSKNLKFVTLVERGGQVRSRKLTGAKGEIGREVRKALYANVDRASTLHTDLGAPLKTAWPIQRHWFVDHSREHVSKDGAHINTAEGYFSIFKRGLVGVYQHMSEQHLHRYLAEFDFRMSNRARLGIDDGMRAEKAIKGIVGKRLTYRSTNAAAHA